MYNFTKPYMCGVYRCDLLHTTLCSLRCILFKVSVLNKKLASREAEFDGYRQQVLSKPESKLQAELTMVHMEKVWKYHIISLSMQ